MLFHVRVAAPPIGANGTPAGIGAWASRRGVASGIYNKSGRLAVHAALRQTTVKGSFISEYVKPGALCAGPDTGPAG